MSDAVSAPAVESPEVASVTALVAQAVKSAQTFDERLELEAARLDAEVPYADPTKRRAHLERWAADADAQRRADLRAAVDVADEVLAVVTADAERHHDLPSTVRVVEDARQETMSTRLAAQLLDEVTGGNVRAWLTTASLDEVTAWYAGADDEHDRARVRAFEVAVLHGWTPPLPPERAVDWHTFLQGVARRRAGRVPQATKDAIAQLETARRTAATWAGVLQGIPGMDAAHTADILRRRALDRQR